MIPYGLFAVIVNWNLANKTILCVDSLLSAGLPLNQIIVVDNGSDDNSVEELSKRFGDCLIIITNKHNKGFAAGVNQGIREAIYKNAKWIFLINNDAYVDVTFFDKIIPFLCDEFDILSPIIYYHDRPNKIWFVGDRLIPGTLFSYGLWKNRIDDGNLPESIAIDFANGAGMLIKREVFEKIGFFDEQLFMYGEEVDFCWRAKINNLKIVSVTGAKIWHEISASTSSTSTLKHYLKTRNQTIFYRRYTNGLKRAFILLIHLFIILIKSLRLSITDIEITKSMIRGYIDGLRSEKVYQ